MSLEAPSIREIMKQDPATLTPIECDAVRAMQRVDRVMAEQESIEKVKADAMRDWMESFRPDTHDDIQRLHRRGGIDGLRKWLKELETESGATPAGELKAKILVLIEEIKKVLPPEPADILASAVSFRERQEKEYPPRVWYGEGMIPPGFVLVTGKKSMGKTFFLIQGGNAIGDGAPFLGRQTTRAKVLFVSFELDEGDLHERFKDMGPMSENVFVVHTWAKGEQAFVDAERAFGMGFRVLIFDTFLPMLPVDPNFRVNEYGDTDFYLRWRLLAKKHGAAIVASWHEGKSPRDDFMLSPIGSTGMVAQADSVISIDRKRGDSAGKLFIGGNHAPDSVIPIMFENGRFKLAEGEPSMDRLTQDEEKTLELLSQHPEGCTTAAVSLGTGKSNHAAIVALGRLVARGKVIRMRRGVYAKV